MPSLRPTSGRDLAALAANIYLRYLTDTVYAAVVNASPEPFNALIWEHLPTTCPEGEEFERLVNILELMVAQGHPEPVV